MLQGVLKEVLKGLLKEVLKAMFSESHSVIGPWRHIPGVTYMAEMHISCSVPSPYTIGSVSAVVS